MTQGSVPYSSPAHKSFYTSANPNLTLHETAYFSFNIEEPQNWKNNIFKLKEKFKSVSVKREDEKMILMETDRNIIFYRLWLTIFEGLKYINKKVFFWFFC